MRIPITNTITTPNAEASLRAPDSHFAHIRTDKTWLLGPDSIKAMLISRNTNRPVHSPPNTRDGLIRGAITHHIVPSRRAPQTCADSSNSLPTCNNAAFVIRVAYDNRLTAFARIITPRV